MKFHRSYRHFAYSLLGLDLFIWMVAFACAYWLRHSGMFPGISPEYVVIIPLVILIWLFCYAYFSLYTARLAPFVEIIQIVKANFVGMLLLLSFSFFYRDFSYSRIVAVVFPTLTCVFSIGSRNLFRVIMRNVLSAIRWKQNILILGCGEIGRSIMDDFLDHTSENHLIGFLDDQDELQHTFYRHVPCLGKISDLVEILDRNQVDMVIIAFTTGSDELYQEIIELCSARDIQYRFVPKMFKLILQDITVDVIGGVPLVGMKGNCITGFNYILKRLFDIAAAMIILILVSPLMLVTAVLIKIFSPGPIFYTQIRYGYRKKPFTFYKFRSMHVNSDDGVHQEYVKKWINGGEEANLQDGKATVYKLTKDPRIIPVIGSFIRKFSIDELPQLFNVIKGDMSLVGPRPCLEYEMEQYQQWHKARFDALPGITGLWQVSGRNRVTFDEMVRLDIHYLQNWTFGLDFIILLKTPLVVLFDKAY